jgi:hypothetical protein
MAQPKTGRAAPDPTYLDAVNVLTMRLKQMDGLLCALMVNYTQQNVQEMEHIMPAGLTLDALSGLAELLAQAKEASNIVAIRPLP